MTIDVTYNDSGNDTQTPAERPHREDLRTYTLCNCMCEATRRERIATALLAAVVARGDDIDKRSTRSAVEIADELIYELDKPRVY